MVVDEIADLLLVVVDVVEGLVRGVWIRNLEGTEISCSNKRVPRTSNKYRVT